MAKSSGRPPRSADDIATFRAKVAKHALAIYRADGFGAVSMRRLAQDVGCTPTTIYAHFDGKTDILRLLWADVLAEMADNIRADIAAVRAPTQRLRVAAQSFVSYWSDHPEHFRLVFMSADVARTDVTTFLEDTQTRAYFQMFPDLVAALNCPPEEVKTRADALLCGLIGIALCTNTIADYPWPSSAALITPLLAGILPADM